jgi:hypothetical protein
MKLKLTFGKHEGKSVEVVVLKEPEYAMWIFRKEDASGPLADIRKEVLRLINVFNSKPPTRNCSGCNLKMATRFSLASYTTGPYWWCDECDPRSIVYYKSLTLGKTYQDAMEYARRHRLIKDHIKVLLRNIAEAKGLPRRVGEKQAEAFFRDA